MATSAERGKRLLMLVGLFLFFQIQAQEMIEHNSGLLFATGDHLTGRYIRMYNDHYRITDLKTLITTRNPYKRLNKLPGRNRLHVVQDNLLITEDPSRVVFRAGPDSMTIIHPAYRTKSEICHVEFVVQDTLYRFGGYGFWTAQSILTRFDQQSADWKAAGPLGAGPETKGLFNHFRLIGNDHWYFIGGRTVDKSDPINQPLNDEAWMFSRNNKSWSVAGKVNLKLLLSSDFPVVTLQGDETLYLFPVNGNILEADFRTKKLRIRSLTRHAREASYESGVVTDPVISDGSVFYLSHPKKSVFNPEKGIEADLVRVPLKNFLGPVIDEEPLYRNDNHLSWWWLMLPVAAIGLVLPFRKKLRRSTGVIFLQSDAMICDGVSHPLDEKSVALLRLLLTSPEGVGSATILELIQNPALDISQNTRTKIRMVETLNIQLRNILDTREDVIRVEKSEIDRRIKVYRIDREKFRLS